MTDATVEQQTTTTDSYDQAHESFFVASTSNSPAHSLQIEVSTQHPRYEVPSGHALALSLTPSYQTSHATPSSGAPPQTAHSLTANSLNPTRSLPALLRYIDNDLMQYIEHHDRPPQSDSTCSVCFNQWDTAVISNGQHVRSTYLPLTCGHFIHYRCFVWLTTRSDDRKDRCNVCHTKLFDWEGITTLTIATRTGFHLPDSSMVMSVTDEDRHSKDCTVVQNIIQAEFFKHLRSPLKYADGSPNLPQCFNDVLATLSRMNKPQSKWLKYKTNTGYLLWTILVAIKMRRYLVESHQMIQCTEAWSWFEIGMKDLQDKIMVEVHKSED